MQHRIRTILIVGAALAIAACGGTSADGTPSDTSTSMPPSTTTTVAPTTTMPANFIEANAFVSSVEIVVMESFPVQVRLDVDGDLPTPCHHVAWQVGDIAKDNTIDVRVYSMVDPSLNCLTVLDPFSASIDLGSVPSGTYTIVVNGEPHPLEV